MNRNVLSRAAYSRSDGFTLIEMMLAVMILGIVLATLAESFNAVAHSRTEAENHLNLDREGRSILWAMSNELRDAVQTNPIPSRVTLIGHGQMANEKPLDSLTVATLDLSHSPSFDGFGAEQIVSYTTAPNPQHQGWFLLQRTEYSALLTNPPAAHPVILASNLISLHIRYFDGSVWNESWDSSSLPSGRQLPLAVKVDVIIGGDNGRRIGFGTQVSLPMAFLQW